MEPHEDGIDDEEAAAVLRAVGKVIKFFREQKSYTQLQLGKIIGYSEEQVSSVERGRRAPAEKFLEKAEVALDAGGMIAELKEDVEEARYPKKVRDLSKYEAKAVEICAYNNTVIHGLLQTPEYARALYELRRPVFPEDELQRLFAARMARQRILDNETEPIFSFVQEEVTLLRPVGGKMALRRQLEHLLKVGQRRNVEIQMMPTDREDHAGLGGSFQLLRLKSGRTVAHNEAQLVSRLLSQHKEIQTLDIRCGIIRAQALTPSETMAHIEKLLGDT
ncbi:DNA-binding protein [Streptomyces acidiscabies]|uniref:DNA-binding protein n=2 Tax=Streptomyces acidiscabies TaxID=42234 RepID=A0A0L0K4P0_9ACTN|nr:DNA-binding protein [Streptomyces acidiscabies]